MATRRRNMTRRKGRVVKRRTMRRRIRRGGNKATHFCPKCDQNDIKFTGSGKLGEGLCKCNKCNWTGQCGSLLGTSRDVAARNARSYTNSHKK